MRSLRKGFWFALAAASLIAYGTGPCFAGSEAGFIVIGGGSSESGGLWGGAHATQSPGVLWGASSSESGGPTDTGAESESGGVAQSEATTESGTPTGVGSESEAQYDPSDHVNGAYVQYYGP